MNRITLDHRIEMVRSEIARLQKKHADFEKKILKEEEKLRIEYDEINERIDEIKESAGVFQRDVLSKAHPETHKIPFENFIK